ncbi:MAG: sigma-70 family RNA polymerase sigma factor [Steroidobacteraceae bacterium]
MARLPPATTPAAAPTEQTLYARYASALSRYLIRRVRRPEDVDDLTQEIFERFVKRKDRMELVRDPLAYLFRIAFHVVGEALADEQRHEVTFDPQQPLPGAELYWKSGGDDAEELAVQEDVQQALAQLPKNHLTALMLVEGHGLSYKEAAKISGFTPSTIATYVMHGRAALKLALDDSQSARRRDHKGPAR